MRFVDFKNVPIYLNNEQSELYQYISENTPVQKKSLSVRQTFIVDHLVNNNIVIRKNNNGSITYTTF
jgi:hypothetical protein